MTIVNSVASTATKNSVDITNNKLARAAYQLLREAKEAKKQAEAEIAEAEAILWPIIGRTPGTKVVIKGINAFQVSTQRTHRGIDMKDLLEAWPDAYAATLRETPFVFFDKVS